MEGYIILNMTEYAQVATSCIKNMQYPMWFLGVATIILVMLLIGISIRLDSHKKFLKKHNLTDKFYKELEQK